ncbi:MerR family transcriptional regulator [Sphaerisporangium sp. NPDC005289]|uniref:MerR family transcriptional regulator n=1 Tax=Sphaerisporangium sp. NPDC005289 TaxID=3155247 RepID=UPI0033A91AE7
MDDESGRRGTESEPPEEASPGFGIGAVARRLGVPAPTLRTWNLRYGIGPSHRSPGGHRRYDAADLVRLEEMSRLVKAGVPPAEAARSALRHPGTAAPPEERAAQAPGHPGMVVPAQERAAQTPPRDTAVPGVTALSRAVLNLDDHAVTACLHAALDRQGVVWTWERLVQPVFAAITRRQERSGAGIEIEHLFSERLLSALIRRSARPERPIHPRPVLLACAEEEQHTLPVHALAAALTTAYRLETRVLGARTPYAALAEAMRRVGPLAVFVWSQVGTTGDPAPLRSLPALRPASRIFVGGPGWWDGGLPPGVTRVASLREAQARIRAVLGP